MAGLAAGGSSKIPGLDPLWMLNQYFYLDNGRDGKRPMTFSRYAGPGSHRYPVGFSGDTVTTWESLDFQPYFTANASNIGYGWWSNDIGGYPAQDQRTWRGEGEDVDTGGCLYRFLHPCGLPWRAYDGFIPAAGAASCAGKGGGILPMTDEIGADAVTGNPGDSGGCRRTGGVFDSLRLDIGTGSWYSLGSSTGKIE